MPGLPCYPKPVRIAAQAAANKVLSRTRARLRVLKYVIVARREGTPLSVSQWEDPFAILRRKWSEIPGDVNMRVRSEDLLALSDDNLLVKWQQIVDRDTQGSGYGVRGWYHDLYRNVVSGQRILDVGCGLGISTIPFAEIGAHVTFVDIVESNVEVVRRICQLKGLRADFCYMSSLGSLDHLPTDFDFVTALGSLINAPLDEIREEVDSIVPHLRDGGRWLHFAYPESRWRRDGRPPLYAWGRMTDGPGTPWMEWHDRAKVISLFPRQDVKVLFDCEWHGGDFNWFDLEIRRRA